MYRHKPQPAPSKEVADAAEVPLRALNVGETVRIALPDNPLSRGTTLHLVSRRCWKVLGSGNYRVNSRIEAGAMMVTRTK
jgi:hypothetical protein